MNKQLPKPTNIYQFSNKIIHYLDKQQLKNGEARYLCIHAWLRNLH